MRTIRIENIAVKSNSEKLNKDLAAEIVKYVQENKTEKEDVDTIVASFNDNDELDLEVSYIQPNKIERLRRITGYLTTSLDRWNYAKQCEERDRVKHL